MGSTTDYLRPVAQRLEQKTGRRPSPGMISRICRVGNRAGRLDAVKVYGQWHCTEDALMAWLRRSSELDLPAADDGDTDTTERDAATERRLQAAGLL